MSLNLASILRQTAKDRPDHLALVLPGPGGDLQLSYRALDEQARRLAGALRGLGLRPGQHVALLMPNLPAFSVAYFACHYAGLPVVPLNVLLTADEIAYHLDDSDAVVLVTWEGLLPQALAGAGRVPHCRHVIVAQADPSQALPEGALGLAGLIAGATPLTDLTATMPDDTAVVLYTSGTTGRPKGAELTHFNMYYNAEYVTTQLLPLSDETRALVTLPLFHSFGQTVMHNAVLRAGGTLVLLPRFDAKTAMALMTRYRVTFFGGVPTMYFALLHSPDAAAYDLSSLRSCVCGGAPMPVEVMRAFDARYQVNILEGYGLSETSPVASFNVLHQAKKVGSIGLPLRGVEFRLMRDGQEITKPGEPGEICIKGHNVMKGYYKRPEETAAAIQDGWFHSGDVGVVDEDGYYRIVDRIKDMIIRGGFNVYPRELEEVLYAHPAVAEAAVIGVPHEVHGEEIKAVVALKPGHSATPEEITAYCREHLAAYKYPRIIDIIAELPKGPTGKILKRALRDSRVP